ncbi:ZYRO0E05126p [Zygosaccharomyces rouxii]|uniref:Lysophospholipase n=1 Tax=Zygosaccharomyces rouxii (strain ATCC 2623 / CBS 732 / NBRC 1130 / NCYC 568 / NRRL Y-229) TaxID=559307 RepID=C5E4D8_ZYGRC|nr:uncharacterized protein ZYRO0E05126g [Zygosaccharomyces rouxii]KAH9198243.1 acyl transferase/acyl hydrolase/lysophospholipase [Zygosaccharomyces rouxii]CAR30899.1 ZYRO0E05126p [Zygosaccharomyces rouxii]
MGLAISGGGYRSMLTASGFIKEMDNYGIFDCLSYISGLSGGSWVLMDLLSQNFNVSSLLSNWKLNDGLLKGVPDFDIRHHDIVSGMEEYEDALVKRTVSDEGALRQFFYNFEESLQLAAFLFQEDDEQKRVTKRGVGPLAKIMDFFLQRNDKQEEEDLDDNENSLFGSIQSLHQVIQFYIDLHLGIRPKKMQGFTISFTDYLGKALKKKLSNTKGQSSSFSQLMMNSTKFQDFKAPIPLFIANCRNEHLKNVIFEFNPFEFGSWESNLGLFVKMPYLGSTIEAGNPSRCINGFDDIGFITATSSSIFNNVLIYIWQLTAQSSRETMRAVKNIMSIFGLGNGKLDEKSFRPTSLNNLDTDYAVYQPNPFYHYPGINNELTQNDYLYLVDGGEDGENIPLRPLTIPQRNLDIIFVIDSSSDEFNYPRGKKLKNVLHQLQNEEIDSHSYSIPDFDKVNQYPIALGCYQPHLPIILYHPNAPHSYNSNTSTFKITYNESEVNGMLQNGRVIFSLSSNPEHMDCIGCLIAKRRIEQVDKSRMPKICRQCFEDYCH